LARLPAREGWIDLESIRQDMLKLSCRPKLIEVNYSLVIHCRRCFKCFEKSR
jgi:hypothetical protein